VNAAVIAGETARLTSGVPWLALLLLLVTLLSLPNIARVVRGIVPGDEPPGASWSFRHLALVALVFVLALVLVPPFVPLEHEGLGLLVLSALTTVPPIACVFAIAWVRDPRRLWALGFRRGNFLRAPLAGLIAYVLAAPGLFALMHVWIWILERFGVEAGEQSVIQQLRSISGQGRWLAALLGVLVMPFFEELLFRGFLQPVLVRAFKPAAGIALTSALFAGLHGTAASGPIFGLSCLLGYVMLHTQRLHAAWTIHAMHNGLQFLILYLLPESVQHATQPGGLLSFFTR
jgi:membrane protease YdiL (CAAX protease family)